MKPPSRTILLFLWFAGVTLYSMYPVHHRTAVLTTMGHDLANHVRHVYEAGLALREGQVPPLVAPALDDKARVPLFQYYSGTSYLLPAAASAAGLNPYRSLKIGIFAHVLAGGVFVYATCRLLGAAPSAALAAGTAFQLAPFSSADLYARGSYTEFAALHAAPMLLYCALRLVRSNGRADTVAWTGACGLAAAYYIPLHPVQTMLCGALVAAAAAAHALVDRRNLRRALPKLIAAAALGAAASAWFWVPVLRDYDVLRIVPHGAFLAAGLAEPGVLLWPGFREAAAYPWAPQLGLHFAVAAVVALVFWKESGAVGVVAALSLALVVAIVLFHPHLPAVQRLLTPLQWSYRLLVPATVAGAVCAGLALSSVLRRVTDPWAQGMTVGVAFAYVVAVSVPYFLGHREWDRTVRLRNVLSPTYKAPNTAGSYALRGTDYRLLNLVRPDGTLNVNADLPVPPEGVPTEVRILLRRPGGIDGGAEAIRASVGAAADQLRLQNVGQLEGPSHVRLVFTFQPRVGHTPGDTVIRIDSGASPAGWAVEDLTFRATTDDPALASRVPRKAVRQDEGKVVRFTVEVAPGREGMYQLPVFVLPSNEVEVNGSGVSVTPSANKAMVTVPLGTGTNVVKIRTRPSPGPWAVSVVAAVAMAAGAGAGLPRWRKSGQDQGLDVG